jgi:putative transposase
VRAVQFSTLPLHLAQRASRFQPRAGLPSRQALPWDYRIAMECPERAQETAMPQSLAKDYIHLIFSTKNRERTIQNTIRSRLHEYMGGILNHHGCVPIEINSEPDYVHILFLMTRTESLSDVIGQLKKSSNDWLKSAGREYADFYWQGGYAAFSVSKSQVDEVRRYIQNQQEHHRVKSFQEELRAFFKAYEMEYDERYVWE